MSRTHDSSRLSLSLTAATQAGSSIDGHPYRSVVVIGAGASGLFAAKTLLPRFPDVLILEAQVRTTTTTTTTTPLPSSILI